MKKLTATISQYCGLLMLQPINAASALKQQVALYINLSWESPFEGKYP
jgi:hypothetical protein